MRAGRMCYHQIPFTGVNEFPNVALEVMRVMVISRKEVTAPRIVTSRSKCTANRAGIFAGNQDVQRGTKLKAIPIAITQAIAEYRKQKTLADICKEFKVNRNSLAVYLYGDKHSKNRPTG